MIKIAALICLVCSFLVAYGFITPPNFNRLIASVVLGIYALLLWDRK